MANEYFQPGSVPAPNSPGSSAVMRNEFGSVGAAFDKLPVMAGHPNEIVVVNASGTALVTSGAALGNYVTKDGVFTLTNKTIAWANNTFPGFGSAATKNAGSGSGDVPILVGASLLPALDGSLLTNLNVNQVGSIVDIAHGGTGANTYAGAQAALGITLKADANNAVLTGAPTAPHPPTGNDSARVATTHFVQETVTAIGGFGPGNAVPQMNGVASPGVSTLGARTDHVHPTDTSRAPTSAATAAGTSFAPAGGIAAADVQAALVELDSEKANLVSPTFSGDPKAPTPTAGDNDTSIATTAFVQSAIAPLAPLASPVFTGDPRAPTTATSDNDTSIATTAFVQNLLAQQPPGVQVSNSTPLINGVAAPGTGVEASRYDHVHPTDTSRAPSSAATATGTSFTPLGNIAATNVQAAIAELDTEKLSLSGGTMTGGLSISSGGPQLNFVETDAANKTYTITGDASNLWFRENGAGGTDILTYKSSLNGWDCPVRFRFYRNSPIIKRTNDAGDAAYLGFRNQADTLDAYVGYGSGGTSGFGMHSNIGSCNVSGAAGVDFIAGSVTQFSVNPGGQLSGAGAANVAYGNGTWLSRGGVLNLGYPAGTSFGSGFVLFGYGGGAAGAITLASTSSVAYNTMSDYRLKDDPQDLTGSGEFIDALRPRTWVWKVDGAIGVGFIAHEVQAVSPSSVTGEKDGENMQMMEYGSAEFIANIIAELQDLRRRVAELESTL